MTKRIKKSQEKDPKKEFEERVTRKMRTGFDWSTKPMSVQEIVDMWDDGKIIDPDYQRKIVWQNPKKVALIETMLNHGGSKIPTLTFRRREDGKLEIVDGKQRICGAIIPFCKNKFRLNGVYEKEFSGRKILDIKEEYPEIYSAFMGTSILAQIAEDMDEEEARVYFIQINTSGVRMNIGEQIHGMQGTPLIRTIDKLIPHRVWNNVQNIKRYGEYAYIGRMLLHVVDIQQNSETIINYSSSQLLNQLEKYYEIEFPKSVVSSVQKTFDVMSEMFKENNTCLNIREFYPLFMYVNMNLEKMDASSFGAFVHGLYTNIRADKGGMFRTIKYQHTQQGFDYNARYYNWYIKVIGSLYNKYQKGVDWNEIGRLSVTG